MSNKPDKNNDTPVDPDLQAMLDDMDKIDPADPLPTDPGKVKPEATTKAPKTKKEPELGQAEVRPPTAFEEMLLGFNDYRHNIEEWFENDRIKIQEYLDMIVADALKRSELKTMHIDGMSSLMATKAMTSANKIRMLDSIAKMMAALKNYDASAKIEMDLHDLDDILNSDADDDAP